MTADGEPIAVPPKREVSDVAIELGELERLTGFDFGYLKQYDVARRD